MSKNLQKISAFSALPDEYADELESITGLRNYAQGKYIFQENDPGLGFYGILSGRIKIFKSSPAGKEHILHIFGPGQIFAEVAVFAGLNYPAHALALEPSTLLFFPRDRFRSLLADNPDISLALLGLMSVRLKDMVGKIEELSLKEVPSRLAAHLLLLRAGIQSEELELDMSKNQLASLLGTIPETLSRVMRRLKQEMIIDTVKNKVIILDLQALEDLASGRLRL